MFEVMENLKIVSSFHNESKPFGKQQKRLAHGFVLKIKGCAEYVLENNTISLHAGEAIFLPKDSSYSYTTHSQEGNLYTSINFQANIENPVPRVYSLDSFHGASYMSESFSELWNFGSTSDKYKCLSIFYDFLSYVSRIEHLNTAEQKKYNLIEPAVQYMKKHIFDSSFKISKLHSLCGISDTYFRKIFISRFNMTPQEYVVNERISRAKSIIESGDFDTIKEVSESVGYSDQLYFSKAFKKICGVCPSNVLPE